ncbi:hypothetical protein LTR50_000003 [Elasticomyces elasticus]|nr:hypothetical protein LTR50_000003 [Elasticomyces elasticus]
MAGRRLVDLAKLFNASRATAKQHVALRSQQWEVHSQTSSLLRAIKGQTDRVTVTAGAAAALARRFSAPSPSYSTPSTQTAQSPGQDGPVPRQETVTNDQRPTEWSVGPTQDHHYEREEQNASTEPPPWKDMDIRQEKSDRYPLPDGTIPPAGAELGTAPSTQGKDTFSRRPEPEPVKEPVGERAARSTHARHFIEPRGSTTPTPSDKMTPSSLEARKQQRQAEAQIPAVSAETQPSTPATTVVPDQAGDGRDTFNSRSQSISSELSSLPRTKIPKHTETSQGTDEHVRDGQLNQDVYYSSKGNDPARQLPSQAAVPEQEVQPEELNTDIFHSPRIASLLGGRSKDPKKEYAIRMKAASSTPTDKTRLSEGKDQDTFSVRMSGDVSATAPPEHTLDNAAEARKQGDEDVRKLAEDMAKDAENASTSAAEIPTAGVNQSESAPFEMRESRVPSSRFGRLWQYGGLATSMAFGAVGEGLRRVTGGGAAAAGSLMLSEANMERLVAKLSRMRGAALKLGQMMSFQDSKMLPPAINAVLSRVQDSADYMPPSQRNQVLEANLGSDWRSLFTEFNEKPVAAASIGQVHRAVLASTSMPVAVKIQYPGVRNSIDSDLSNLSLLLTASRLLPKGLYLDKTIANARTELGWECDYIREAECGQRFYELLQDERDTFTVPCVIPEASGREVLTAEYMTGKGVTKIPELTQEERDWIGTNILRLSLRELTEWYFMQTDPNWTNFLYNRETKKLELLDFGASRDFPVAFVEPYIRLLIAATQSDWTLVRDLSIQLGYLTGQESKSMLDAHVSSVLTLAEPFTETSPEVYDFRDQTITDRVREKIGVMVRERLAPPPEETYSLHRKLSGAFLLCARLGARVRTREMFEKAIADWKERMGEGGKV